MNAVLSVGPQQTTSMSPRMQQAIRLLQMSAVDFELALRDALGGNPFLEATEEHGQALASEAELKAYGDETTAPAAVQTEAAVMTDGAGEAGGEAPSDPRADEKQTSEPLPDSFAFERSSTAPADDDGPQLGWVAEKRDLRDYLRSQLYASRRPARETLATEVVIESLDDDGYLRDDLDELRTHFKLEPALTTAELEAGLALLRQFDPPGVGARSLVDCLLLQLAAYDRQEPGHALAVEILRKHLLLLSRRDFYMLRRRLSCDEAQLHAAIALIRRLDPDPASRFTPRAPDYVVPDAIVIEHGGRFVAQANPLLHRGVRLNERYVQMFRGCRRNRHPAMAQQLQEARWLVRNAEQRGDTILRVAHYIVERQQAFFRLGDIALRPMVLREVATELGLHESTVSRATGNKYLSSPRGCFEFKHFFPRELPMRQGPSCSAAAVRTLIQNLIDAETRHEPLSDVDIAAALQAQGIRIARRTVTKYRRMLKLPPAEFRKVS